MGNSYIRLKEIKSELAGYLKEAQSLLMKSTIPDEASVHDIRVLLKKARATLKLTAGQSENDYTRKDINSLREAAKIMSHWRDTSVHRKTLKSLKKEFPDIFLKLQENEKILFLMKKTDDSNEPTAEMKQETANIEKLLINTMYRIRFRNMDNLEPRKLLMRLEQTYQKCVDVFLACRNKPGWSAYHEFRKKSKDLLYQLYFFRHLNTKTIRKLGEKLEVMTNNLGKVNDLGQLLKALDYKYPCPSNDQAMNELMVRIRERQDNCFQRIWPVASKIFLPGRKILDLPG